MEIYKKIQEAKQHISMSDMKKEGHNDYSNYDYFTPDQVNKLVFLACQQTELLTIFNLKRNEFGHYGELTILNLDNTIEFINVEISTAIPEITATNAAQQLGGCVTYTERYLKMTVFGISDNTLDFDSKNNSKQETKPKYPEDNRVWLSEKQKSQAIEKIRHANFGSLSKEEFKKKLYSDFRMKKVYKEELDIEFNSPFNEALSK